MNHFVSFCWVYTRSRKKTRVRETHKISKTLAFRVTKYNACYL